MIYPFSQSKQASEFLSFTIDLFELNRILMFNIPDGLDVFVIDRQGINLLHETDDASWVGGEASKFAENILRKELNQMAHVKLRDGRQMIYAQRWVSTLGWYVMVGEPEAKISGSLQRNLGFGLLYFIACLSLALTIAWRFSERIASPIRNVARSARARKNHCKFLARLKLTKSPCSSMRC
jgi:hypothetical protein